MARIVKEAVSDAIAKHLNDPRIKGIVSVTRVDMSTNLRSAEVYLSIFGDERGPGLTLEAIMGAKSRIQGLLADRMRSKFCPVLRFHTDEKFKKTLETIKLIDQAVGELEKKDSSDQSQN